METGNGQGAVQLQPHVEERERKPWTPRLMPRDLGMLRAIFSHKFLQLRHLHALFGTREQVLRGTADTHLARRLRFFLRDGFLVIPEAARRTQRLKNQKDVYSLTRKGAILLEESFPEEPAFRGIRDKNWWRSVGIGHIDHELAISTLLIVLKLASDRARLPFSAVYAEEQENLKLAVDEKRTIYPDACFRLSIKNPGGNRLPFTHFVEIDHSGTMNRKKLRDKFLKYALWKSFQAGKSAPYRFSRVLTFAKNAERRDYLRALLVSVAKSTKQGASPIWNDFLFASMEPLDLASPEKIFTPHFFRPFGDEKPHALTSFP